jgi:N-acetylmuramoyl-L-alanine amidase
MSWKRPQLPRQTNHLFVLLLAVAVVLLGRNHVPSNQPATSSATPVSGSKSASKPSGSVSRTTGGPRPVVFIDPGHGGIDQGTIGVTTNGQRVSEKTVTLAIAKLTAERLGAAGIDVVLSRTDDSLPGVTPDDYTTDGGGLTGQGELHDLQRRIDRANASDARLLLSIHFNANDDPSIRGVETYYDAARPFAAENLRLARLMHTALVDAFRSAGYSTPDRGIFDDSELGGGRYDILPESYRHLVLLGPEVPGQLRPSQMPGVLSEPLMLSNPGEASAAIDPQTQALIADAYVEAITTYLAAG